MKEERWILKKLKSETDQTIRNNLYNELRKEIQDYLDLISKGNDVSSTDLDLEALEKIQTEVAKPFSSNEIELTDNLQTFR